MKSCKTCHVTKPFSDFHKWCVAPDGHVPVCKACKKVSSAQYYIDNRAAVVKRNTAYRKDNPQRNWRLYKYGVSVERFAEMEVACGGVCEICHQTETFRAFLCVDHNKHTGVVRGLLCRTCNLGIGHLQENPDILDSAKEYLRRTNAV